MMRELVFAGYGGQGVLTTGLVLLNIYIDQEYNATWIPSYGSAMRGGTANCTVKYSQGKIYNPSQEEPNLLLAMNLPSFEKFKNMVAKDGCIVINTDLIPDDFSCREDIKIVKVPAFSLAEEIKHQRGSNIIMAGVIHKLLGDFPMQAGIDAMNKMFRNKGKEKFEAMNTLAFENGYKFI